MQQSRVFRIFIASPNDLGPERKDLKDVVNELNDNFARETDLRIELIGWEDTLPGNGRPQELINSDLDKADLFIGCLWQRLGSSASEDGRTGFEEEFYRTSHRFSATGAPDIWLFFKEVDANRRADPGEQLRKVISFREKIIGDRQFLFRDFSPEKPWRDEIRNLLTRRILKLISSQWQSRAIASTPQSTTEEINSLVTPRSKLQSEGLKQLIASLRQTAADLDQGNFGTAASTIKPSDVIRLLLFAAGAFNWEVNPIDWGVHEVNAVYLYRDCLTLVNGERDFLLRIIAFDSTFTKPGWFWAGGDFKLKDFLGAMTADREPWRRTQAIELATMLGISLLEIAGGDLIRKLLLDQERSVRTQASMHLGHLGKRKHLRIVKDLLDGTYFDDEKASVREMEQLILIRATPAKTLYGLLSRGATLGEDLFASIRFDARKVAEPILLKAFESPDFRLRAFAIQELERRKSVSEEILIQGLKDPSTIVKEEAWRILSTRGKLDPKTIRDALPIKNIFEISSDGSDRLIIDEIVYRTLKMHTNDELWSFIQRFDENSALALQTLAGRATDSDLTRIRTGLEIGFEPKRNQPTTPFSFASEALARALGVGVYSTSTFEPSLRKSALEVLVRHASKIDRDLFLRLLSKPETSPDEQALCLTGLSIAGLPQDMHIVSRFLQDLNEIHSKNATRAYLRLADNFDEAVDKIAEQPTKDQIITAIEVANEMSQNIWHLLKKLTSHANDAVRKISVLYAAHTLSRVQLIRFLEEYSRQQTYFYDVAAICDLFLYAPKSIMKFRLQEIFEKDPDVLLAIEQSKHIRKVRMKKAEVRIS